MILIFTILIILLISMHFQITRCLLILMLSAFFVCGQLALVVSDHMTPNINVGDYILCIKPVISLPNSNTVIADISKIPLIGKLLEYHPGQSVIVKSNTNCSGITVIRPKIVRIICTERDVLKIEDDCMYINNKKVTYNRFADYFIEQLPNGKKYLVILKSRMKNDVFRIENNKVLCMYDNRSIDGGFMTILDKKLIHSIPIINLTNIAKYYKFLIN